MDDKTQSRKWLITINNPIEKGYTHEVLESTLSKMRSVKYWCLSDETGHEGTFHTHVFIYSSGGVRFSTLVNNFKGGHFDIARGTCSDNRDYVFKEGKWLDSEKSETNHRDSHMEYGELPVERQGARNDLADLYDMISDGMSNYDIISGNPTYMLHLDKIERVRQTIRENKFCSSWRDVTTTYIYGSTGSGKTRGVMEQYGYENVYRITDYLHPFDTYSGEDVIIFEEFRSSLRIGDMLNYLDGYPVKLPCRYLNKEACFSKVYIISNIDLREQYVNVQEFEIETWNAFLRRINEVCVYSGEYTYELPTDLYLSDCYPFIESCPFEKK